MVSKYLSLSLIFFMMSLMAIRMTAKCLSQKSTAEIQNPAFHLRNLNIFLRNTRYLKRTALKLM